MGYIRYSMSERAYEAYRNGEMPLSKWNKSAILDTIGIVLSENDLPEEGVELFRTMKLAILKTLYLEEKGWHHTSKFYNITTFYGIDEDRVLEFVKENFKKEGN